MKGKISYEELHSLVSMKNSEVEELLEANLDIIDAFREDAINQMLMESSAPKISSNSIQGVNIQAGSISFSGEFLRPARSSVLNFKEIPEVKVDFSNPLKTFRDATNAAKVCEEVMDNLYDFIYNASLLDEIIITDLELEYLGG